MMKPLIISLLTNPLIREISKNKAVKKLAFRYIGDEDIDSFIPKMDNMLSLGYKFTLSFLGEHYSSVTKVEEYKENVLKIIRRVSNYPNMNVSIKLSALGLLINEECCQNNLKQLLEVAQENNLRIHIDMESSEFTEKTLNIFSNLRENYNNLDITFQAYLYRTSKDIEDRIISKNWDSKPIVRICKGAYKEPFDKVFPNKKSIDENYYNLAVKMLDNIDKVYPAFATHDSVLIEKIKSYIQYKGISKENFEFQMLYGIKGDLQRKIIEQGYNLRIYVPIGREWYDYFVRRIAEKPITIFFVLYSLIANK